MHDVPEDTRQVAGLYLKNVIHDRFRDIPPVVLNYVKDNILQAVGDPSRVVRSTVGTCIEMIARNVGLQNWPQLLPGIGACLDGNNDALKEGAFNALLKICEQDPRAMDEERLGRPLNWLVPKLLPYFDHPLDPFREYAITIIKQFLMLLPNGLVVNMRPYLEALYRHHSDPNVDVRRRVLQSLTLLIVSKPDYLQPHDAVVNCVVQLLKVYIVWKWFPVWGFGFFYHITLSPSPPSCQTLESLRPVMYPRMHGFVLLPDDVACAICYAALSFVPLHSPFRSCSRGPTARSFVVLRSNPHALSLSYDSAHRTRRTRSPWRRASSSRRFPNARICAVRCCGRTSTPSSPSSSTT